MNSPIAVFLYNRPDKSYSCLKSLSQNQGFNDSPLYIFIDGPKSNKDKSQIEGVKKIESTPAPLLGEHTDQILRSWLNFDQLEIDKLRDKDVVA